MILLLIITYSVYSFISLPTTYAKKSHDTVLLNQGEAMKAEFQSETQEQVKQVTLSISYSDKDSDPFASYHIPITVEVYEKNQLVGSEHVSYSIDNKPMKITVDVNNDPMIKGNYKVVVTHDIPEDSKDNDRELLVDIDSIKFNKGDSNIYHHGMIKTFSRYG